MGYDTGIADRIRAKGVTVVEVAGWKTRGAVTYEALLALWHHTAGAGRGTVPSLAVCTYGRPGVPGPLCQVLQSREGGDGLNDKAYVIAAGRANHAGTGRWRGISGNSRAGGVEVEHIGTTTQPVGRHEVTARILAALLEGPGGSRDARNACRHAEYATPPGRKPDFALTAPWTAETMRSRVGFWIGRTIKEDEMTPADWTELKKHLVNLKQQLNEDADVRSDAAVKAAVAATRADTIGLLRRLGSFLTTGREDGVLMQGEIEEWLREEEVTTLADLRRLLPPAGPEPA